MKTQVDKFTKAIQTRYKGHHFRSRLEARWAVFFDAVGVRWEYEKEGYDLSASARENLNCEGIGWYLPDFWLPDYNAWIEIKAEIPTPHWEFTLPEVQVYNLVYITNAKQGWVFFGLPDIETPCSEIAHYHHERILDYPLRRVGGLTDLLSEVELTDEHFNAAKSARFEFGHKGAS